MTIGMQRWLEGYTEIRIQGDVSLFLRLACRAGLSLCRVRREGDALWAEIPLSQRMLLRDAVRQSHCRLHFCRRRGLPFWGEFCRRRPALPLMALLTAFLLAAVSTLVFSVSVVAENEITAADEEKVLAVAADAGLRPLASRMFLDSDAVEAAIMRDFPQLFFVEINTQGTAVRIHVAKRTDPPPLPEPGDVVAQSSGVIRSVLVNRGTAAVKEGDVVKPGDVLIWGWLGTEPVAADGMVIAEVEAAGQGEFAYRQQQLTFSGKKSRSGFLRINGGALLHVYGPDRPEYSLSQGFSRGDTLLMWRKMGLCVEIIWNEYAELIASPCLYSREDAESAAVRLADNNARADLFSRHDLGSTDITATRIDRVTLGKDSVLAEVTLFAQAEIGVFSPCLRTEPPGVTALPETEEQ